MFRTVRRRQATPPVRPRADDMAAKDILTLTPEDIAGIANRGRLRMAFPPAVESLYRRLTISGQYRSVSMNWSVGICLYDLFLANDELVAPHDIKLYIIGRLACMTPISALALAIGWRYRRFYEVMTSVPPVMMSITLSVLIMMTHGAYRTNYLFGDILLMMCATVISRPRMPFAVGTVIVQCVWFCATLFGTDVMAMDSRLVSLLFCFSGAVVSCLTAYALEQASRDGFLMQTRITFLNRELETAATTDPLTGLVNRRGLALATEAFWETGRNAPRTISLILIDVDRFKAFNDNYGHPAGDECLSTIAKKIRASLRSTDELAVRFGGEELLVVLPGAELEDAKKMAERLRQAIISAQIPHPVLGPGAVVTASLGVATSTTAECSVLELTAKADSALYAAKTAGRNRVWPPVSPENQHLQLA